MWDCKHHQTQDDTCKRRKTKCFPGGVACVLKGAYEAPFRQEEDPLLRIKKFKNGPSGSKKKK